jgi:hypothetical protein
VSSRIHSNTARVIWCDRAEVLDGTRDLVEIPVKTDDDGNVAVLGENALYDIQPNGQVDPLSPRMTLSPLPSKLSQAADASGPACSH